MSALSPEPAWEVPRLGAGVGAASPVAQARGAPAVGASDPRDPRGHAGRLAEGARALSATPAPGTPQLTADVQ